MLNLDNRIDHRIYQVCFIIEQLKTIDRFPGICSSGQICRELHQWPHPEWDQSRRPSDSSTRWQRWQVPDFWRGWCWCRCREWGGDGPGRRLDQSEGEAAWENCCFSCQQLWHKPPEPEPWLQSTPSPFLQTDWRWCLSHWLRELND